MKESSGIDFHRYSLRGIQRHADVASTPGYATTLDTMSPPFKPVASHEFSSHGQRTLQRDLVGATIVVLENFLCDDLPFQSA